MVVQPSHAGPFFALYDDLLVGRVLVRPDGARGFVKLGPFRDPTNSLRSTVTVMWEEGEGEEDLEVDAIRPWLQPEFLPDPNYVPAKVLQLQERNWADRTLAERLMGGNSTKGFVLTNGRGPNIVVARPPHSSQGPLLRSAGGRAETSGGSRQQGVPGSPGVGRQSLRSAAADSPLAVADAAKTLAAMRTAAPPAFRLSKLQQAAARVVASFGQHKASSARMVPRKRGAVAVKKDEQLEEDQSEGESEEDSPSSSPSASPRTSSSSGESPVVVPNKRAKLSTGSGRQGGKAGPPSRPSSEPPANGVVRGGTQQAVGGSRQAGRGISAPGSRGRPRGGGRAQGRGGQQGRQHASSSLPSSLEGSEGEPLGRQQQRDEEEGMPEVLAAGRGIDYGSDYDNKEEWLRGWTGIYYPRSLASRPGDIPVGQHVDLKSADNTWEFETFLDYYTVPNMYVPKWKKRGPRTFALIKWQGWELDPGQGEEHLADTASEDMRGHWEPVDGFAKDVKRLFEEWRRSPPAWWQRQSDALGATQALHHQ